MTRLDASQTVSRIVRPRGLPGGVGKELVVTLRGDGTVEVRELRRRSGQQRFDLGALYLRGIITRAGL